MKTNIILRDYQNESLRFLETDFEKLVLAMCPSSGKTETIIYYIDQLIKQNKNFKVLILPHSTNVLLNNFYDRLEERNVGFTYSTDTSVDCNVHILLPQSKSKIKDEYDLLIIDEAHENYFAKTVQNIIIKTNPKKQILLTGTPYQFIGKDDFKIHFLALNELDKNTIPKLRVDIIESNYQWNGNYNSDREVKKEFDFNNDDTKVTLDKTFNFILKRGNIKKKSINKTLIVCNNIKQSEFVKGYLDGIGLSSVLSNSKNDTKSELVQDFKQNKINILIVVNRARLGYDDIDLINLIDISGTLNPNLIYQMISRVLRGDNSIQKYYIRLTSKKDESLNSEIATNLAFMLTDKKYISTFNGKNFNNQTVIVPNFFSKKYLTTASNFRKNTPKLLVDTDDIISFYRNTISDIDKQIGLYKFCEIKDVLKELGVKTKEIHSFENCKEIASKFKTKKEWYKNDPNSYRSAYNNFWLKECCAHMIALKNKHTLESCKKIGLKYKTRKEWQKSIDGASYQWAYKNNLIDFCCEHMPVLYLKTTFEECKKISLKYKTKSEWAKSVDRKYHNYAEDKKWIQEFKHLIVFGKKRTLEECKESALKYNSRVDWQRSIDSESYWYASRRDWLEECCKHMVIFGVKRTLDDCKKIASNYKSKIEWLKSEESKSYWYAQRRNWLEECAKHFKK